MNQNWLKNLENFVNFLMVLGGTRFLGQLVGFYIVLTVNYKVWQNTNKLTFT